MPHAPLGRDTTASATPEPPWPIDWAATALGPPETWPGELRASFAICLASPMPTALCWGRDALLLYNDAFRTLLRARHPAAFARPLRTAWPEGWDALGDEIATVLRGQHGSCRDGQRFDLDRGRGTEQAWFRVALTPVHGGANGDGPAGGVLCTLIETTALVEAEHRAERLGAMLNMIDDHFALYDLEWRYLYVNDRAAEVLGLPKDDLLGRSIWELFPDAVGNPYYEAVHRAARDHVVVRQEHYYAPFDSWFENQIYPLPNAVAVFSTNITERKRAELARQVAEDRLRQAQRMEAVGTLAGGVAHEVNNMMTAVIGFGGLVLRALGPEHPQAPDVREMVKAAERASSVTRQLLAYSRRQVHQPVVLNLNLVVTDLTRMLERLLGPDHVLRLDLAAAPGRVRADKGQVEQVLVNLVLNARDAMAGRAGRVTIQTLNTVLDQGVARQHPELELRMGPYVLLAVRDEGVGMTPEVQVNAFLPFFTTKPVGQGTGLGLATVYGIVKQSEGYVFLESEVGQGTTVRVYLPQVDAPADAESVRARPPARGHETIMVVEDEPIIRGLVRRGLEALGYRVLEAGNGHEALAAIRDAAFTVDLVLCDVIMPEMGGREFGEALAALAPSIAVLYMSGYAGDEIAQRNLLPPGVPFLGKPFTPDALAERVREILDQAP